MSHYWRFSFVYGCYFAVLGLFLPYWPSYLKQLGFGAVDIGLLLALPQLTKLFAPNLLGYLADVTRRRRQLVLWAAFLAALVFTLGAEASSFWGMAWLLLGFSFFWNAIIAQYEAMTLSSLGTRQHHYSRIRLWGSIGFIVTVLGGGWLLGRLAIGWLPWLLALLLWLLWLATCGLPRESQPKQAAASGTVWRLLRRPGLLLFFACALLMQVSHGSYYAFYTIYLQQLGWQSLPISLLWTLGVVAEIGLFLLLHRVLAKRRLVPIMQLSLALAALRWWLIGAWADVWPLLVLAQLLHAASFASFHAASVNWVQQQFGERLAGQGQALYSSLGMGAGWALGAWLAGLSWAAWQGDSFLLMALIAAVACVLSLRLPSKPSVGLQ